MKMRDFVPLEDSRVTAVVEIVQDRTQRGDKDRRKILRLGRVAASTALAAMLAVTLALPTGCNSNAPTTPQAKPEPKAAELLTGRSAFYKTYIAARNYAADAKPFRIESMLSSDGNGHDGKSAIWRASFASANQHGAKPFFWSGSNAPDAPSRGVSFGNEDVYNPGNASTHVFDVGFLKVDSDQAFTEAQKHGGDKVLEKDAATPVFYVCDWNHNSNELTWHVIYGGSRETAKLTVAVNATTGEFIRVEK